MYTCCPMATASTGTRALLLSSGTKLARAVAWSSRGCSDSRAVPRQTYRQSGCCNLYENVVQHTVADICCYVRLVRAHVDLTFSFLSWSATTRRQSLSPSRLHVCTQGVYALTPATGSIHASSQTCLVLPCCCDCCLCLKEGLDWACSGSIASLAAGAEGVIPLNMICSISTLPSGGKQTHTASRFKHTCASYEDITSVCAAAFI
jgi:hypothetical protein